VISRTQEKDFKQELCALCISAAPRELFSNNFLKKPGCFRLGCCKQSAAAPLYGGGASD